MEKGAKGRGDGGDRLDWDVRGFSVRTRRIVLAAAEGLLSDEDEHGHVIPGGAALCERSVDALDHSVGRSSQDLRRGFLVLALLLEWLPILVIRAPSRMSRLPIAQRLAYFEALEASSIGWLAMLLVAFKVPLCIPAFEEGDELASTGFDRPSLASRRKLPVAPKPPAQPAVHP